MVDYKTLSEAELTTKVVAGDKSAFAHVYDHFGPLMLSFAVRRLSDREIAKDIVHDIFADLWNSRHNIWIPRDWASFLIAIVRNRIFEQSELQKSSAIYWDVHWPNRSRMNRYPLAR